MMWMQQSQVSWLKEGDCDIKKFHRKATSRMKKNRITRLQTDNGRIMKNRKEMGNMARTFSVVVHTGGGGGVPS
jgi:hypothetical protein